MMNGHYTAWGTMTMVKWFSSKNEIHSRAKTQRREEKQKTSATAFSEYTEVSRTYLFLGGFASLRELVFSGVHMSLLSKSL